MNSLPRRCVLKHSQLITIQLAFCLFPGIVVANSVQVPVHLKAPLDVGPVFLGGTFNGWSDSNPEYELTDPDDDGEWSAIVSMDAGTHHFRYHQGHRQWIRDPNISAVDAPWGNSELTVSDPMLVYLLPLDGDIGLRPGEPVRAVFGFSAQNPIDPTTLDVKINGVSIAQPQDFYDQSTQEFRYVPPTLLAPGTYTVEVSADSAQGSVNQTTTFDRAPAFEILTQDIDYRKSDIVAYGLINDPGLTNVTATINGSPAPVQIVGNQFRVPITLVNGSNHFHISGDDGFGNTATSSQVLTAIIDRRPSVEILGSIDQTTVNLVAQGQAHAGGLLTYQWSADTDNPQAIQFSQTAGAQTSFTIPESDGEYLVSLLATDSNENSRLARQILVVNDGVGRLNQINDHAQWIEDMILYEMMPELSAQYGNLSDAIAQLPYVASLGVNTVLITPVFATEHDCTLGYDTTNYYDVCVASGDELSDFVQFVDNAHANGLRVILDIAFSHTGYRHPFFQNVLDLGSASPFSEYYIWDGEPGNSDYEHENLLWQRPYLNLDHAEAADYLIDVAEFWIEQYGIDGYHLDVAVRIDERTPTFLPEFRKRLRKINPEVFLVSEGVPPSVQLYEERFDSNFDFDLRGWGFEDQNALINLLEGTASIDDVHDVLARPWPEHARPIRFVEQHNQDRMPWLYDLARSKLTHSLVATVPGIPFFFAGGEVGHSSRKWDVDTPVDWDDSINVRPFFKKLIDIRREHIRNDATLTRISNSNNAEVYAYRTESAKGVVSTLLNFAPWTNQGTFDASNDIVSGFLFYQITDLIDDSTRKVSVDDLATLDFSLEGYESSILHIQPTGRFDDVEPGFWAFSFIETLAAAGITAGCGGGEYCPDNPVSRAQMAVFLERGINGAGFSPPPASGDVFNDVSEGDFAAAYIEQLAADGITAGCGNRNYCPTDVVTRAQMAVFLLRAKYGAQYSPPPATGMFADVPLGSFADAFIEQLAAEGISVGCGGGDFCPTAPVTRDQMAVFLVRTFGL